MGQDARRYAVTRDHLADVVVGPQRCNVSLDDPTGGILRVGVSLYGAWKSHGAKRDAVESQCIIHFRTISYINSI